MALDIQALDIQPMEDTNSLDIQPLDIQPMDEDNNKYLSDEDKKKAIRDGLTGIVDAGLGMVSGLPSQIAGGVAGLSTLLSGQGLDKAANTVQNVQNSNFGFGAYKPFSKSGEDTTNAVSGVLDKAKNIVGDLGYKVGGELGRTNAEIAAESLANLVEPGAAFGLLKGALKPKIGTMIDRVPTGNIKDVIKDIKSQADKIQPDLFPEDPALGQLSDQGPQFNSDAGTESRGGLANKRQMDLDIQPLGPESINVDKAGEAVRSDANPNDLIARDAAQAKMQSELDSQLPLQNQTSLEGPGGQMSLFDQPDVMGQRNQFNGGQLGDWRIDENGMPVKVDKSMEALNLENPLQRSLFGDELGPAQGQDRGLTAAIDSIPDTPFRGDAREQALSRLNGGAMQPDPALLTAVNEANGPKLPFDPQTTFDPRNPLATERLGNQPIVPPQEPPTSAPTAPVVPSSPTDGSPVTIHPTDRGFIAMKDGQQVGRMDVNMTPEENKQLLAMGEKFPATVDIVKVSDEVKGTGVGSKLYDALNEAYGGNIMPSGKTTPDAWKVWKGKFPEKVKEFVKQEADRAMENPNVLRDITDDQVRRQVANQMQVKQGAPSETLLAAQPAPIHDRPSPPDTMAAPRSPEKIAAKQQVREASKLLPVSDPRLTELRSVTTPEEALQLSKDEGMKDNAPSIVGRNLGSGANYTGIKTNNPIIQYVSTVLREARVVAEGFSKKYITAKDGLTPMWEKLNDRQRVEAHTALLEGDRQQVRVTDDMMDKMGLNDVQKAYINKYYEGNKALWDRDNQVKGEMGMKPTPFREGHFPSIFKGGYKSIVTNEHGVSAVLATDSKYQMNAAIAKMKELDPKSTFSDVKRKGLANFRNESDILSGMNDVIAMLAEKDPKFAEVQAIVSEAIKHGNNSIFAFNVHELSKKGVIGNEGNKPWLSPVENAKAAHQAMVQYFEEGALHHELQKPLKDIKDLMMNPETESLPKTRKYVDSYLSHITGKSAQNPIGNALNFALDAPGAALGFGPRTSLKLAGAAKNRMSQVFMGFLNYMFTAAQVLQPMQTGAPFMAVIGGRLGNTAKIPMFMAKGATTWLHAATELMTGKDLGVNATDRKIVQRGIDRGLAGFSEMEKAYEGGSSKAMRVFNNVAEANMKAGETFTRMPQFIAYTYQFMDAGISLDRSLQMAEKATQLTMFDYHQWERPQLYAKLGVLGNFAGALTTFKHAYVGNQIVLGKEIGKTGNPLPIAASAASMIALAGVAGMPGYDELDNLYGAITNKFFGKRMNIRDSLMSDLPEAIKSGYLGAVTGVAMQSKFSSANLVPDYEHPGAALSPQISAMAQVVGDGIDIAKYGDKQSFANLMLDLTPSGLKGVTEDAMFKDEDGNLLDRQRRAVVHRSPEEWDIRKFTGLRSNREMLQREQDYRARNADMADQEARKKISQDVNRAILNDDLNQKTAPVLAKKFMERGGDVNQEFSIQKFKDVALQKKLIESERAAAGIKPTPGSMRKFEYYNKPGER